MDSRCLQIVSLSIGKGDIFKNSLDFPRNLENFLSFSAIKNSPKFTGTVLFISLQYEGNGNCDDFKQVPDFGEELPTEKTE